MVDLLKAHNDLVMKIGDALEGVEADKASAAMLEVIAIGIVNGTHGDVHEIAQLCQLSTRTLVDFAEMHLNTYRDLKARGKR